MFMKVAGAAGAGLVMFAAPAAAESAADGAVATYEPGFFDAYHPSTALDMVREVPGFSISEGASVRGFDGAAGNVLLNGVRPSTKAGLSSSLKRIPADSVIRIELVTAASGKFDMQGQSKLVNVVVREASSARAPIVAEVMAVWAADDQISGRVTASTQTAVGGGTLTVSGEISNRTGDSREVQNRTVLDDRGDPLLYGAGFKNVRPLDGELALDYERRTDWGAVRLNGTLSPSTQRSHRYFELRDATDAGTLQRIEASDNRYDEQDYTFGADIQRDFGAVSAKAITFHARRQTETASTFAVYGDDASLLSASTTRPEKESGESILRGQADWRVNESHSLRMSAEAAYNFLESITELERRTPTDTTRYIINGSDTTVAENRGEIQVSDVWQATPSIVIEAGLGLEVSRIEQEIRFQDGRVQQTEREFTYPKPSLAASWRIDPARQLRLSLEREVAQLSFGDFVSSVQLVDDQSTSGNPDLEPQRTWAFDVEVEQEFWTSGVVTLAGSFDRVEDVEDYLPLAAGNGFIDAPGNIGDGERWSIGANLSAPLEAVGLPNARLDVDLSAGSSAVVDPTTSVTRRFSGSYSENFDVSFRQDFPASRFSYGVSYDDGGPAWSYRLDETTRTERSAAEIDVWAETTRLAGLRTRLGVSNVTEAGSNQVRTHYTGPRDHAGVEKIWDTFYGSGLRGYLTVSGSF